MTTAVNYASEGSMTRPEDIPEDVRTVAMTTLTREKIEVLRAAARKATPGPWTPGHLHRSDHECDCPYVFGNDDRIGAVCSVHVQSDGDDSPPKEEAAANQVHIANCDPATILSLCDMAEAGQTDRVGELVKALNIIDALDPEEHVYGMSHDACRGLVLRMGQIARTALSKAQEDGE